MRRNFSLLDTVLGIISPPKKINFYMYVLDQYLKHIKIYFFQIMPTPSYCAVCTVQIALVDKFDELKYVGAALLYYI